MSTVTKQTYLALAAIHEPSLMLRINDAICTLAFEEEVAREAGMDDTALDLREALDLLVELAASFRPIMVTKE